MQSPRRWETYTSNSHYLLTVTGYTIMAMVNITIIMTLVTSYNSFKYTGPCGLSSLQLPSMSNGFKASRDYNHAVGKQTSYYANSCDHIYLRQLAYVQKMFLYLTYRINPGLYHLAKLIITSPTPTTIEVSYDLLDSSSVYNSTRYSACRSIFQLISGSGETETPMS